MVTLHEGQYTFVIITHSILLRMRNVWHRHIKNHNTHFTCNNIFFKSCHLWDNVEKYCTVGVDTDDNMAHVHCMLDT
jgi:hypothetical protein